jgi:hypothetical protein
MGKFKVYPKKGDTFDLEFYRFEYDENSFRLYDDSNSESSEGFLSFEHVAAIIPETQSKADHVLTFLVYLKGRTEPLKINANTFDQTQQPGVKFYVRGASYRPSDIEVQYLYVATSEVVAIVPSDGLKSYRH